MNIILFYQHVNRELFSVKKLQALLEKRGNECWVFSIDFENDLAYKLARKRNIDIIVTPWMYHDTNYQALVPIIKKNPNVKIINLHSEQIYSEFGKVVLLPASGASSLSTYHLCWGDNFRRALLSIDIPNNLIFVTGNMRNDEARELLSSKESFAERYNLDIKKKWLLYAENRNFVKNSNALNVDFLKKGISEEELVERFEYTQTALEETIEDINSLPKKFFEEYELIYRAHPGFQGDMGVTNCNVHEISDLSIYEWLNVVDACIVWNSTTAFEADIVHVPVFVCVGKGIPPKYRAVGLENYFHIKNLKELMDLNFDCVLKKQDTMKNYVDFYGDIDGNSTLRVADAIDTIYHAKDGYKAMLIPIQWRHNLRRKASLKVTRLIIKLGIFEILKYPRSSYQHKKDIPYLGKEHI